MDQFKSQAAGLGVCSKIVGCICSCGCLAAIITFTVYCGMYAFNNPEPQAYYIAATGTSPASLVGVADVDAVGVTAVHDQFVRWFTWVFAQQMVMFFGGPIIVLLVICIMRMSACLGNLCGVLMACGFCGSGLGAWIAGMVWRFSEAGRVASGDYLTEGEVAGPDMQIQSGKFMGIYYLITWIMMGVSCGCSILGAIVADNDLARRSNDPVPVSGVIRALKGNKGIAIVNRINEDLRFTGWVNIIRHLSNLGQPKRYAIYITTIA